MGESNWGGRRSGSGKKPSWKSGSGKPIRIPEALHEAVLEYARELDEKMNSQNGAYENKLDSAEDERLKSINSPVGRKVARKEAEKLIDEMLDCLQTGLSLKANAGGKIKQEIRKVIEILERFKLLLEIL